MDCIVSEAGSEGRAMTRAVSRQPVDMRFVVDKVAPVKGFLPVL